MQCLFCVASFIFTVTTAQAELFRGPLSSATGGTGRAGIEGSEAALLNPALIPLLKTYEFAAFFRDGYIDNGHLRHAVGVGAGDNGPDVLFPGGLHYIRTRETGKVENPVDGELIHAAVGKLVYENVGLGVSGYRLSSKVQGDKDYVQYNYAFGALWMITQSMGVGYVLNNLAKPSGETPIGLREETQQGLGLFSTIGDIARMRLDITRDESNNPLHKLVYMAGFENISGKFTIFRMGYKRNERFNHNFLAFGFSFNGPRLKVDYSLEKKLTGTSGALHSVDLRIPF